MILTQSELDSLAEDCQRDAQQHGRTTPCDIGHSLQRERIALIAEKCCQAVSGDLIEIGCYAGATSRLLAGIARKYGRRLLCVDNWSNATPFDHATPKRKFYETMEAYSDVLDVLEADAHERETIARIQERRFALAFSDNGHEKAWHVRELETLLPVTDGAIAVDDVYLPWVEDAIRETVPRFSGWSVLENPVLSEMWLVKA